MSLGNKDFSKVWWKIRYLLSFQPVILKNIVWEKKKSVIKHAEMWETHIELSPYIEHQLYTTHNDPLKH